jgi:hypothetical protein
VEWNELRTEELNDLYSSPNIIRAGHIAFTGENRGVYRVLVEKSEEKRTVGKPRRRWEDNIKIDFQEVGWGVGMGWIDLSQDWNR